MCSFKHRKILSYDIDFLLNINMKYCTVVLYQMCSLVEVKCYKLFQNLIAKVQFLRSLDKNRLHIVGLE